MPKQSNNATALADRIVDVDARLAKVEDLLKEDLARRAFADAQAKEFDKELAEWKAALPERLAEFKRFAAERLVLGGQYRSLDGAGVFHAYVEWCDEHHLPQRKRLDRGSNAEEFRAAVESLPDVQPCLLPNHVGCKVDAWVGVAVQDEWRYENDIGPLSPDVPSRTPAEREERMEQLRAEHPPFNPATAVTLP